MIDLVTGNLLQAVDNSVVINVGGIGLRVEISDRTRGRLTVGDQCSLFTHLTLGAAHDLRPVLYGFPTLEERRLFRMLCSVSGVGVKTAMGLMGAKPVEETIEAIATGHTPGLRAKGVGKKTAERIVIELRDKASRFFQAPAV